MYDSALFVRERKGLGAVGIGSADEGDQASLASSPFFAQRALPRCALDCSTP
jgi:hypothetical protein